MPTTAIEALHNAKVNFANANRMRVQAIYELANEQLTNAIIALTSGAEIDDLLDTGEEDADD